MLSSMELIGLLLGTYGGLVLVIPEVFEKYCFCLCIRRKKSVDPIKRNSDIAVNIEDLMSGKSGLKSTKKSNKGTNI